MNYWHRGDHVKHPTWGLSRFWQAHDGAAIYQGRIARGPARVFVYRLVRADGTSEDFRLLRDAMAAGRLAVTP